jgi:hypothetical protein
LGEKYEKRKEKGGKEKKEKKKRKNKSIFFPRPVSVSPIRFESAGEHK